MNSFSVLNFKSFGTLQEIPIKPITLIYGANSAGKSSILHSYLLLRNFYTTTECDIDQVTIGGDTLDLGGFKQFLYKKDYSKKMVFEAKDSKFKSVISIAIETNDKGHLLPNVKAVVNGLELYVRSQLVFKLIRKHNGLYKAIEFNYDETLWDETEVSRSEMDLKNIDLNNEEFIDEVIDEIEIDLVESIRNHKAHALKIKLLEDFPLSHKLSKQNFISFFKLYIEGLIRAISLDIGFQDNDLVYLGPLRSYPPRRLSTAKDEDSGWNTAGGNAWEIVKHDSEVREKVNEWLMDGHKMKTRYKLEVKKYSDPSAMVNELLALFSEINIPEEHIPEALKDVFSIYMDYDEEGEPTIPALDYSSDDVEKLISNIIENQNIEELSELLMLDINADTSVSHRDIGVGISQVLPVLVNAYASKESVIAIEQPEIHLHPGLQSELADVFINTALGENKNTYLLETHSEHLLLRIMRRIRETTNGELPEGVEPITANDVQVLFVTPGKNVQGSVIKKIALDEEGELIDTWPGGFFEEGFNERFGI